MTLPSLVPLLTALHRGTIRLRLYKPTPLRFMPIKY